MSPSSTSNLALGCAKAVGQPAHSQQGQPWKLDPKDGGEHWPGQGRVGLWSGFSRAGAGTEREEGGSTFRERGGPKAWGNRPRPGQKGQYEVKSGETGLDTQSRSGV